MTYLSIELFERMSPESAGAVGHHALTIDSRHTFDVTIELVETLKLGNRNSIVFIRIQRQGLLTARGSVDCSEHSRRYMPRCLAFRRHAQELAQIGKLAHNRSR